MDDATLIHPTNPKNQTRKEQKHEEQRSKMHGDTKTEKVGGFIGVEPATAS